MYETENVHQLVVERYSNNIQHHCRDWSGLVLFELSSLQGLASLLAALSGVF